MVWDTRQVVLLTPLAAVLAGIGARPGAGLLVPGIRARRPIRVLPGAAIVAGTVLGLGDAVHGVVPQTYVYRADVSHEAVPIQGNSWTASLYRRYARKRSIIITDTLLPFLDDQGVTRIARIVPVTRGEYWDKPPLLGYPRYADRYRAIDRALRDGTLVYTDAPTFNAAFINRTSDPGSWHALVSHHLVPVGAIGPDIVYRLALRS